MKLKTSALNPKIDLPGGKKPPRSFLCFSIAPALSKTQEGFNQTIIPINSSQ